MRDSVVKWLEALRSGEFEKCCGWLESDGAYCCLGVACVVAEREGVPVKRGISGSVDGKNLLAQRPVQRWLGLRSFYGLYSLYEASLTDLNDTGKTFAEIADIIEKRYDDLFEPEVTNER